MPWDVLCFLSSNGPHQLKDAYSELFERADGLQISKVKQRCCVQSAGNLGEFPNGWFSNPVSGVGLPVFYWSKRIWDTYTDERKAEVRQRVPNVEQLLR